MQIDQFTFGRPQSTVIFDPPKTLEREKKVQAVRAQGGLNSALEIKPKRLFQSQDIETVELKEDRSTPILFPNVVIN
jgi:hypothetical protein